MLRDASLQVLEVRVVLEDPDVHRNQCPAALVVPGAQMGLLWNLPLDPNV